MGERAVFPGSFRPFHNEHLEKVRGILEAYPSQSLIIVVSERCLSPKKYDFICGQDALEIVSLTLKAEKLDNRVSVRLIDLDPNSSLEKLGSALIGNENIKRVFTGSEGTIKTIQLLRDRGLWNGELVQLNNSGIHAEQIRQLMLEDGPSWKEYVHPSVTNYLENVKQNFLGGPKS